MHSRQIFILLVFLPIAMAVFFWDLDVRISTPPHELDTGDTDQTSTFLDQVRLTQFDAEGKRSQQIISTLLSSDTHDGTVAIEQPEVTLETDDGRWRVHSLAGEFDQARNRLRLTGSVLLTRENVPNPVQMRTEQLDYYQDLKLAESPAAITIETDGHWITSHGIRIDLTNSVYRLPRRVRSTHQPM